jgi:1-deoxy-D-xylulose-5-phosphate synthase
VAERLAAAGISASMINGRFIKPMDTAALTEIAERFDRIITVEENSLNGGFGSAVVDFLESVGFRGRTLRLGLPDRFVQHGSRELLLKEVGLDEDGIYRSVGTIIKSKRSLLRVFQLRRNGKPAHAHEQATETEPTPVSHSLETTDGDEQ